MEAEAAVITSAQVKSAFGATKEPTLRSYKITLENGRSTVVRGCVGTRITKAGILVLYATDTGKANGGDVVSDNVIASYSPGAWFAIEDVGASSRCEDDWDAA